MYRERNKKCLMLGRKFGLSIASLPIDRGGNDLVYVEKKVVNMQAMHSC